MKDDEFSYETRDCCGAMSRQGRLTMNAEGKVMMPPKPAREKLPAARKLEPRLAQDQPKAQM